MDFELSEFESRQDVYPEPGVLLPAILASLFFHGVLAAIFLNGQIGGGSVDDQPTKPTMVSVRLVSQNPQILQVPEPVLITDESAIPKPLETEDTPSEELLLEESSVASEFENLEEPSEIELDDSQQIEADTKTEEIAASGIPVNRSSEINLPSVLMVQESLQNIDIQKRSRFYSHRCNPLEEEAGIKDCEPPRQRELQSADYQLGQRNSTYRALNPIRQLSRTQRTSKVVSTESKALAGRLGDLRVPAGLSDYILEELEAGITHNADLGNRAVEHMLNSNDKSAAGAMARELLSDPWVEKREKELQQRKVHLPN